MFKATKNIWHFLQISHKQFVKISHGTGKSVLFLIPPIESFYDYIIISDEIYSECFKIVGRKDLKPLSAYPQEGKFCLEEKEIDFRKPN